MVLAALVQVRPALVEELVAADGGDADNGEVHLPLLPLAGGGT